MISWNLHTVTRQRDERRAMLNRMLALKACLGRRPSRRARMAPAGRGASDQPERGMVRKGRRRERRLLQSALRGGAAGVIGGLAIALVEREVLSRVTGGARHRSRWDDVAADGLSRIGLELGDRGRIATGIASQVIYAGLLGAAYGVLREEARDSRAGRILLDGAMTYAASLVFPDGPTPATRGRRLALRRKVAQPVNPAAAFSRVTAMTLRAMT
jgi:hypothetical protein